MPTDLNGNHFRWSTEIDDQIRHSYADHGPEAVQAKFPYLPIDQIRFRASALKVKRYGRWTPEELQVIREKYPTQGAEPIFAMFPHLSIKRSRGKPLTWVYPVGG